MANPRVFANWFSLTFEHTAELFCCPQASAFTGVPLPPIPQQAEAAPHAPTDKAVPPANN